MKKQIKIILEAVGVIILAISVFQIKIISIGDGERTLVYTIPFAGRPGGSVHADLVEELVPVYGEDGSQTVGLPCKWQGENATAYDAADYEIRYLGRSIHGGDYLLCTVTTVRTIILDDKERGSGLDTRRTSTYIGYDDADMKSRERAKILWETKKEDYADSEEYFNCITLAVEPR